jgi:hypothetical protein
MVACAESDFIQSNALEPTLSSPHSLTNLLNIKMFSKLAILAAASMAVFVAAAPQGGINNSCNTGPVQCCNQMMKSDSAQATFLTSLLGISLEGITGQVGAQCSPITAIGLGSGSSCSSQPVCCSNNSFNGLVAVGCSPVNLNI